MAKGKVMQKRLACITDNLSHMLQDGQISSGAYQSLLQELPLAQGKLTQASASNGGTAVTLTPASSETASVRSTGGASKSNKPVAAQDSKSSVIEGSFTDDPDCDDQSDFELIDVILADQPTGDVSIDQMSVKEIEKGHCPLPRCQKCDGSFSQLTRNVVSSANRNGYAGWSYLKCHPCNKFCTWLNLQGVSRTSPKCSCGFRSRLQSTGQNNAVPGKQHYVCALGACKFFAWTDGKEGHESAIQEVSKMLTSLRVM